MLSLCAALSSDTTVMQFKVVEFVAGRRFGWPLGRNNKVDWAK
jgi:hypothetical protein